MKIYGKCNYSTIILSYILRKGSDFNRYRDPQTLCSALNKGYTESFSFFFKKSLFEKIQKIYGVPHQIPLLYSWMQTYGSLKKIHSYICLHYILKLYIYKKNRHLINICTFWMLLIQKLLETIVLLSLYQLSELNCEVHKLMDGGYHERRDCNIYESTTM